MVTTTLEKRHKIWSVSTGTQTLYPIAQVEKLIALVKEAELVERNGFLILPNS